MKILMINGGSSGSSWDIMTQIAYQCVKNKWNVLICTPTKKPKDFNMEYYQIGIGNRFVHNLLSKLDGSDGFHNKKATSQLIEKIKKFKPDIVHLHTLHGYFINVDILCNFLKKNKIFTVITLHDCWFFTGRCAHYAKNKCYKWIDGCYSCSYMNAYPKAFFKDNSHKLYTLKEKIFNGWKELRIVAVSHWLADNANKSKIFRNKTTVETIYNGIDTNIFSDKNRHYDDISNEIINIICVSSLWNESKGISIINYLAQHLPDKYKITMVGSVEHVDVSERINCVGTITSKKKLADLYLKSDFLLNPSAEETFSLVNIEAQACGNRIICYPSTGIKETSDVSGNILVKEYNQEAFLNDIICINNNSDLNKRCANFAKNFSVEKMTDNYIKIYKEFKHE